MPEQLSPEVLAWAKRAQELSQAGEATTFFEIHQRCLGVIVPDGYKARPGLFVCACVDVEPWHNSPLALLEAHGLESLAPLMMPASGRATTRYER